MDLISVLNDKA